MDNYLKENCNPIEDREIQEHFSLGRLDLARLVVHPIRLSCSAFRPLSWSIGSG